MKHSLALVPLLVSCATAQAGIVAMPFRDAAGAEYRTDNYAQEIRGRFPGTQPLLLLLVARSFNEPEFKQQIEALRQVDAEQHQLIVAIGAATSTDKHSYWLEPEDADALLEGGEPFLLLAIGHGGQVCHSSPKAVQASQIVASNNALQPTFLRCAQKRRLQRGRWAS